MNTTTTATPQQSQIQTLMRSDAYLKSWNPDHKETQNKVRAWFESLYNSNPAPKPWQNLGDVLLVGEGNLSFARSLAQNKNTHEITSMIATVFEKEVAVKEDAQINSTAIQKDGGKVLYNIDASKIDELFKAHNFDTIIFQFPNVASPDPKYGRSPNHILMRRFLKTAKELLSGDGRVLISTVDNEYYDGVFNVEEAALHADFAEPKIYSFDPKSFPDYTHKNTDNDKSTLDDHNQFKTWVFTKS